MYTSVAAHNEDKSIRESRSYTVWPDDRKLEQQWTGVNQLSRTRLFIGVT